MSVRTVFLGICNVLSNIFMYDRQRQTHDAEQEDDHDLGYGV